MSDDIMKHPVSAANPPTGTWPPTDDVKPLTAAELDATEEAINQLVKDEDVEAAANALDGIARRLLATARAGLEEGERLDQIEWFGCMTGDCPHETQAECDVAILGVVRSVMAERDAAQAGVLSGVSALPRTARSGRVPASEDR